MTQQQTTNTTRLCIGDPDYVMCKNLIFAPGKGETLIFLLSRLEVVNFLPIDPDFQSKRKVVSEHNGHKVWGAAEPNKLGIHGTNVALDWDVCVGDGVCISVCPVSLYDWAEAPGNQKKSDPAREPDCIQCLACETQCPTQAIKITPPP